MRLSGNLMSSVADLCSAVLCQHCSALYAYNTQEPRVPVATVAKLCLLSHEVTTRGACVRTMRSQRGQCRWRTRASL